MFHFFSLPRFPQLQNEHNHDWSHFIEKVIHLYQFLIPVYQSCYISLARLVSHTSRWLFRSFISLVKHPTLSPSSTLTPLIFASYLAKNNEKKISAPSYHRVNSPSLVFVLLYFTVLHLNVTEFCALHRGQLFHFCTRSLPSLLLKDISRFFLFFCIIMHLFLPYRLKHSHQ